MVTERRTRVRSVVSGAAGVVIALPARSDPFPSYAVLDWSGRVFRSPVDWSEELAEPMRVRYGRWAVRRVPVPRIEAGKLVWVWVWSAVSPYTVDGFPVIHQGGSLESVMSAVCDDERACEPWAVGMEAVSVDLRPRRRRSGVST